MFRQKLRDVPHQGIDCAALGRASEHFSGADIDGVLELAKDAVIAVILDDEPERALAQRDLASAIEATTPSTLEWLKTANNLVKFGGSQSYKEVEQYLRKAKLY